MRQLAHEEIQRLIDYWVQILRTAKICAVDHPPSIHFHEESKGGIVGAMYFLKSRPSMRQVGGWESFDAHLSYRKGFVSRDGAKLQTKVHYFIKKKARVQHGAQRLDCSGRQINRQWFGPPLEPAPLHEHEKTSEMVGMQMRNKNGVDQIVT